MALPAGVGVGDFIAVGVLAWKLYLACSDSPSIEFRDLGNVCLSIHIAIKKIESNLEAGNAELPSKNDEDFAHLAQNCRGSLSELDSILQKYQSIPKKRAVLDCIKFANEDLDSLRAKLNLHLSAINTFSGGAQLEALTRIENRLNEISLAILRGDKDESLLSEHATEDEDVWQQLQAELLEDYGITAEDIETHKDDIKAEITKILMELDVRSTTLFPGDSASCRDLDLGSRPGDEGPEAFSYSQEPLSPLKPPVPPSQEIQSAWLGNASSTQNSGVRGQLPQWKFHKLRSPIRPDGVIVARSSSHWELHFIEIKNSLSNSSVHSNHNRNYTCIHKTVDLRLASQTVSRQRMAASAPIPDIRGWTTAIYHDDRIMLFEERPTPFEIHAPHPASWQQRALQVRKGDSVDGGAYCVFNGVVLCFGGIQMTRRFAKGFRLLGNIRTLVRTAEKDRQHSYEWHDQEAYNPAEGDDIAPHFRRDCTMVAWNNKIYIFGGYYRDQAFSGVWTFDLNKRVWEDQPQHGISPTPRWGHQAVVCNDAMYVSSGRESFAGPAVSTLERFDLHTSTWSVVDLGLLKSHINEVLKESHILTAFGKKLFIVGAETIYELDTDTITSPA